MQKIQGMCPFPVHGRAQYLRNQDGEEVGDVRPIGIWSFSGFDYPNV